MKKSIITGFLFSVICCDNIHANVQIDKLNNADVPASKEIASGNYLTSQHAHDLLTANDKIIFIDVRDNVEIALSGHPESIDAIVPVQIRTPIFDEVLREASLRDNPTFVSEVDALVKLAGQTKNDMIILTCGSGRRSAMAANKLIAAGYKDVWHIPDGYEGDAKPGMNTKNAWRLAGLPWSKDDVKGSEWRLLVD
jgi:rhodanese-related sulfurtransferase